MLDAASLPDWISAGSNALAAVGTIGAFATGFALIKRERDLTRSSQAVGVYTFWQRTGRSTDGLDVQSRMRAVYDPAYSWRSDVPQLSIAGPDDFDLQSTPWHLYELDVHNSSSTHVNTVEVWFYAHDGLDYRPPKWHANTCPIAANANAAPMLRDSRGQYFGFSMRRSIAPGETELIALIAYPSRIAFPEPAQLTFIDGNGIQWLRASNGRVRQTLSSSRKSAARRKPWRREPNRYYWRQTMGERGPGPT